jgi:hypothetical protein
VKVAGTGEGGGVDVEVGGRAGAGLGVEVWQAVNRRRHPRRIFFIMPIKT